LKTLFLEASLSFPDLLMTLNICFTITMYLMKGLQ
jgi:hypothetical protein